MIKKGNKWKGEEDKKEIKKIQLDKTGLLPQRSERSEEEEKKDTAVISPVLLL